MTNRPRIAPRRFPVQKKKIRTMGGPVHLPRFIQILPNISAAVGRSVFDSATNRQPNGGNEGPAEDWNVRKFKRHFHPPSHRISIRCCWTRLRKKGPQQMEILSQFLLVHLSTTIISFCYALPPPLPIAISFKICLFFVPFLLIIHFNGRFHFEFSPFFSWSLT